MSRFLIVPLEKPAREAMIRWTRERAGADTLDLDKPETEQLLRKLVILILSTPEYQLQ